MTRLIAPLVSLFLFGSLVSAEPPAGFRSLFNGEDLSGWRGGATFDHRALMAMPQAERTAKIAEWTGELTKSNEKTGKPHWLVENGILVNDGFGSYATTEEDFGDFELLVDYRSAPDTDAGIYLRGVPQVQIWDHRTPDPKGNGMAKGSGGLWNNSAGAPGKDPLVLADKPQGEWNSVRVLMVGSRVSVWLNAQLVVDHAILENYYDKKLPLAERRPIPLRGPIQLQTHGGPISWRNIFIREIDHDEANRILAQSSNQGFENIFNGRDLAGWSGAVDSVDATNGVITWLEKKGGTLYWDTDLRDFQARLDFKLPPAGNNGLAIRYPGEGNAAYDAMCELQVIEQGWVPEGRTLDERQGHGSAYGMAAAVQGYQRPTGAWNFQEVTVQGSRVKVELNGFVILDADLSEIDPATMLQNKEHPGVDRTHGFFGFAGHNDPVQFRQISVREL